MKGGVLDRCCRLPEPRSLEKPNIELEVILVLRLIWQLLLCSLLFDFPLLFFLFPLVLFYLFQPFVAVVFIFCCYGKGEENNKLFPNYKSSILEAILGLKLYHVFAILCCFRTIVTQNASESVCRRDVTLNPRLLIFEVILQSRFLGHQELIMHYFVWSRSGICKLDVFAYIYLRRWKLIWLASWPHHDRFRKSLRSTNFSDLKF